jgi:serine protease Do
MRTLGTLLTVGILTLASCGGGDADVATDTSAGGSKTPPAETDDTPTVFDISDAEPSVVKIEAEGTFIDPEVGEQRNSAGVGSGVIISDDGLVVTNNHVVTGAALLRVAVPGLDDPVNAQVLGVSECSDLAVIQLAGGDYTALSYRTEEVTAGVDVYAAGYPASDAGTIDDVDYTLTRGIISSTTADGETSWASVEQVVEHDARIRGGNSGGPLLDESGRIVGINYAGIDESDQNYAIAISDAIDIIERLTAGENVEAIGVNGEAVNDGAGLSGIWVASVESGSPADNAGIEPGDVITRLENLDLAADGTMSDYCDVIRTKGADATMSIEVLRFATEEVYEGQLNGTPLELSFSFAQEFTDDLGDEGDAADDVDMPDTAVDTYETYVSVSDDSGSITVDVPAEWTDIDGTPQPEFGPSLWASPDIASFLDSFNTPGVIVEATGLEGPPDLEGVLMEFEFGAACTFVGTNPYSDPLYTGLIDEYTDCAGLGTSVFVVAVTDEAQTLVARVMIQAVEPRDLDAADRIFATFVASP